MQAGNLTPSDVRDLQVCVQQQVERERQVLAGVVHPNVEVKFLLPEDQSVRYAKAESIGIVKYNLLPNGPQTSVTYG